MYPSLAKTGDFGRSQNLDILSFRPDKMSLNAKILTDRDDYDKLQKEAGVKMEKIRKKASEVKFSVHERSLANVDRFRQHKKNANIFNGYEDFFSEPFSAFS